MAVEDGLLGLLNKQAECHVLGRLLPVGFQPRSHENRLSNSISMSLAGDMRRPDRTELEAVTLLCAALVPTAY
ncbi:hypothetical protein [Tsuneonella rigui]|uniref:hypothetical protein n=1 Tax=Tsuneonella rigui TaxID=1708790 RepID=UPI000F7F75FA|nr:hypothetical protein [Tsuneonella rigui]